MKLLPLVLMMALAQFSVTSYAQAPAGNWGADRHVARGVTCDKCHGANNEIGTPGMDQCVQCHVPEQVAEKTANVKPQNPHSSPHYGNSLDCTLCHAQHSETTNYCASCHDFDFNVK
ncbi:MAG: cytochrome c3 family protein [Burkholderiales bacterium]|nr:cytochrome c3 family protein [Burkholderiales bacterium]